MGRDTKYAAMSNVQKFEALIEMAGFLCLSDARR